MPRGKKRAARPQAITTASILDDLEKRERLLIRAIRKFPGDTRLKDLAIGHIEAGIALAGKSAVVGDGTN